MLLRSFTCLCLLSDFVIDLLRMSIKGKWFIQWEPDLLRWQLLKWISWCLSLFDCRQIDSATHKPIHLCAPGALVIDVAIYDRCSQNCHQPDCKRYSIYAELFLCDSSNFPCRVVVYTGESPIWHLCPQFAGNYCKRSSTCRKWWIRNKLSINHSLVWCQRGIGFPVP